MDIHLYDLRNSLSSDRHINLGDPIRVFLAQSGRLEIQTDLGYELLLILSQQDKDSLRERLIEIENKRQTMAARGRKKRERIGDDSKQVDDDG